MSPKAQGRDGDEVPLLEIEEYGDGVDDRRGGYGQEFAQNVLAGTPRGFKSNRTKSARSTFASVLPGRVLYVVERISSNRHVRNQVPIVRKYMIRMVMLGLAVPLFLFLFLAYAAPLSPIILPELLQNAQRVLLVVAHPDDECLFFSPTLSLFAHRLKNVELSVLVMSIGNNEGQGSTRQAELHGSCNAFNIPSERCVVMDEPDIQDSPTVWWPIDRVADIISKRVTEGAIDTVFTFDDGGISGHINHRAVSAAVQQFGRSAPEVNVYLVYTTATIRKYTIIFDFAFTTLPTLVWRCLKLPFSSSTLSSNSLGYTLNTLHLWRVAIKAFEAHSSQWNFPRMLFLPLNRYMWYNELLHYKPL